MSALDLIRADVVTRQDVRVNRAHGWVEDTRHGGAVIGAVTPDTNGAGRPIFRAQAGDVGSFAFKREDAVARVIELHNLQEKARAYDLLVKMLDRRPQAVSA
jgi:hypothetical protein